MSEAGNQFSIGPGTTVTLHFSLRLEDGSVVDSTFDRSPAQFTVGDGKLLSGFEKKLYGLQAGQRESFTVLPEDGFGQPNPNNVQTFKRDVFDSELELAEGLVVSFADASQSELPGVVKSVGDDEVVVDFNHPLAGRQIAFEVDIIAVEQAQK